MFKKSLDGGHNDIKTNSLKIKEDLFPPIKNGLKRVKINVLINNKYIFPKVGILGNESKPYYVGHTKPVTRIVFINHNILCSISQDSLCIKMWDLNNFNAICLKNIEVMFLISDMILANENNLVVCGEKLIILNVETEKHIIIFQPKFGNYIEYNLLAKINNEIGAASSLGGYFLIFNLNTGEKIKKIEMNKIHFICDSENKKRLMMQNKNNEVKIEEKKEDENDYEYDDREDNKEDKNNQNNQKNKIDDNSIKIKDIGSSRCLKTEQGHKGPVYCIIGLNNDSFKDCLISGGFDNLIKIYKINEDEKVINLVGHQNTVNALTLLDSKKYLISSSFDFTIRKWNLETCSCEKTVKYDPGIQSILIPMMNDFLLSVPYDGKINIWNEECSLVKSYYYQHGAITTGIVFPGKKESEKNMFIFGDHTGEIFIKQIIIGDENIKNFNKPRKKTDIRKSTHKKSITNKEKDKNKDKV